MKKYLVIISVFLGLHCSAAVNKSERDSTRLESLFIWKVSDQLELDIETENKFSQTLRELGKKKRSARKSIDELTLEMTKKSGKALSKLMTRYQAAVKTYSGIHVEEVNRLRKILGEKKLAQYLILKNRLNSKMKALLTTKKFRHQALQSGK